MLQLRAQSAGFDREAIVRAAEKVHASSKKLYVTVNSFARSDELMPLHEYARFLRDANVDAAIVSDIGAIAEMKKACPELSIHLSTQANCMNSAAARVYYDMGVERIVLARELTIDDIADIRANTPKDLEFEAFVHGAMCMAYSGRCLISSFITGRSGNRGECAQPCRWKYAVMEEKRPGEYFTIEEENGFSAVMSSHDLCSVEHLEELNKAGVCSFKIEGRMKTPFYVASVTNAYRRAIDKSADMDDILHELDALSHRPYTTGFYFGELGENHANSGVYIRKYSFAAAVIDEGDGYAEVEQRNLFKIGDRVEVVSPNGMGESFIVEEIKDMEGNERDRACHPKERLIIKTPVKLYAGDYLRVAHEG